MASTPILLCYRPFDLRWLYWEPETKLLDEKREEYVAQRSGNGLALIAAQHNRRAFDPPYVCRAIASLHVIERGSNIFPLQTVARRFGSDSASLQLE